MMSPKVSTAEATEMYALTLAYLCHATFDSAGLADTMFAKEVAPGTFHLWNRQQCDLQEERRCPVATCTYEAVAGKWTIELNTAEYLILLDQGSTWEPVDEKGKLLPPLNLLQKQTIKRSKQRTQAIRMRH